jgi:hypothetical protein
MTRTEPCACGARITTDAVAPGPDVLAHNRSPQHTAWRLGMRLETVGGVHHKGVRTIRLRSREEAA